MSEKTQLPDPKERAEEILPDPKEEPGIYKDTRRETIADAKNASWKLREAYVLLDSVLDDRGLFPDKFHWEGREIQTSLPELSEWAEEFARYLEEAEPAETVAEGDGDSKTTDTPDVQNVWE